MGGTSAAALATAYAASATPNMGRSLRFVAVATSRSTLRYSRSHATGLAFMARTALSLRWVSCGWCVSICAMRDSPAAGRRRDVDGLGGNR